MRTLILPANNSLPVNEAEAGFSLLEALIALAIAMLAAASIGYSAPRLLARDDASDFREKLAGFLSEARFIAKHRYLAVRVVFRDGAFVVGAPSQRMLRVPAGIMVTTTTPTEFPGLVPTLVFLPDGSSSGARVVLAGKDGQRALGVSWATGEITRDE